MQKALTFPLVYLDFKVKAMDFKKDPVSCTDNTHNSDLLFLPWSGCTIKNFTDTLDVFVDIPLLYQPSVVTVTLRKSKSLPPEWQCAAKFYFFVTNNQRHIRLLELLWLRPDTLLLRQIVRLVTQQKHLCVSLSDSPRVEAMTGVNGQNCLSQA